MEGRGLGGAGGWVQVITAGESDATRKAGSVMQEGWAWEGPGGGLGRGVRGMGMGSGLPIPGQENEVIEEGIRRAWGFNPYFRPYAKTPIRPQKKTPGKKRSSRFTPCARLFCLGPGS